ncbi:P-loop containing nucleoside triphosphate hydrolase protein [Tothia fuscella]|uniref:P-loop containing nucleoside triphosphate hydrolase protein n=1 Tax=Tothia fuscella TaxID=1048955 RepID=A0A9P4NTG4_9PEZI|nr:P-loop containing nucleoside triphosphate hydrolase protein [Tothia fuscella]
MVYTLRIGCSSTGLRQENCKTRVWPVSSRLVLDKSQPQSWRHSQNTTSGSNFKGRSFTIKTTRNNSNLMIVSGKMSIRVWWCRDATPVKEFIEHCRLESSKEGVTVLRNDKPSIVPGRAWESLDIEPQLSKTILGDARDFFSTSNKEYFKAIGTPLRRGYLLYGPPGTGKTSLTLALATTLGVPLVMIDLQSLDDSKLARIFRHLPGQCIVVFEDIDCASILADDGGKSSRQRPAPSDNPGSDSNDDNDDGMPSGQPCLGGYPGGARTQPSRSKSSKGGVSMSGLINVIDGTSAAEDRIVTMTANAPETINHRLKRPGRIDMQFRLGNSTATTASMAFNRIFGKDPLKRHSLADINVMAKEFGAKVAAFNATARTKITPCAVAEFLRLHRFCPDKAVEGLRSGPRNWRDILMAATIQSLRMRISVKKFLSLTMMNFHLKHLQSSHPTTQRIPLPPKRIPFQVLNPIL